MQVECVEIIIIIADDAQRVFVVIHARTHRHKKNYCSRQVELKKLFINEIFLLGRYYYIFEAHNITYLKC